MKKPAPVVILSTAPLTMPTAEQRAAMKKKRGGNTAYYVDGLSKLAVGKSLAIQGRTKANLSTTISQNNAADWPVLDANGKQKVIQVDNGGVKTPKPVTEKRVFFAVDCDPATDPDKADARIWREK